VVDLITVKPEVSATDVEQCVDQALKRSADLDARSTPVTTDDGTVHLHGHVHSCHEKETAEDAAFAAPGVSTGRQPDHDPALIPAIEPLPRDEPLPVGGGLIRFRRCHAANHQHRVTRAQPPPPEGAARLRVHSRGATVTSLQTNSIGKHMNAATQEGRARSLADGNAIPLLGLGVWQVPNGPECVNAVRWALKLGYRHIDTAQLYGNEESVGQGLRESGIVRDEVFITTKFYPPRRDPVAEVERSLQRLGLDYVDLYLIHWPQGGPTRAWPGMEQARERGYTRSIGVSNFDAGELLHLLRAANVPPAVNQVQFNPYEYRKALLDACEQNQIVLEAYSPLGTGRHLSSEPVRRIAEHLGRTPAQVLLRWCIERDIPVIPKSTHRDRIAENSQLFDFTLSSEDLAQLDQLDRTGGTDRAL
jgi:2,5-diketo-D-gluconate reductase A